MGESRRGHQDQQYDLRRLFALRLRALMRASEVTVRALLRGSEALVPRPGRSAPLSNGTVSGWIRTEGTPSVPEDWAAVELFVDTCVAHAAAHGKRLPEELTDKQVWRAVHGLLEEARDWRGGERTAAEHPATDHAVQVGPGRGSGLVPKPIAEWNPHELGVHPAVSTDALPSYVLREHDAALRELLSSQAAGNRLIVLKGGSSTGKTRSLYEAVAGLLPGWALIHPPGVDTLHEVLVQGMRPRTVLWLDELRNYVEADPQQRVLERLCLLRQQRGQVVVVTTLWPDYWAQLMAGPEPGRPDKYRQARLLLRPGGCELIEVPREFNPDERGRAALLAKGDTALAAAVRSAETAGTPGHIAQILAGAPDVLHHYENEGGDPYGRVLISATMDAGLLGRPGPCPRALLKEAAPGYLSQEQRAEAADDWFEDALAYATRKLKGAVRALTPVPPEDGMGVAGYRLADYLEQHAREHRRRAAPPASLWKALSAHTPDPDQRSRLGHRAYLLGFYQYAAAFYRPAAEAEDPHAMRWMAECLKKGGYADEAEQWLTRAAGDGDVECMSQLVYGLVELGRNEEAEVWLERIKGHDEALALEEGEGAGEFDSFGDDEGGGNYTVTMISVAEQLAEWGREDEANQWWDRAAAAGDFYALTGTTNDLCDEGRADEAVALWRPHAEAGAPRAMFQLAICLWKSGDEDESVAWFKHAEEEGQSHARAWLARFLHDAGRSAEAAALFRADAEAGNIFSMSDFAKYLEAAGSTDEAEHWCGELIGSGHFYAVSVLARVIATGHDGKGQLASEWSRRLSDSGDFHSMRELAGELDRRESPDLSWEWWLRAAEGGDLPAMREVARRSWDDGRHTEAATWYRKLAADNDWRTLREFPAVLEEAGKGDQVVAWLRTAAEEGATFAMTELAELLWHAGDVTGSEIWFRKAAGHGMSFAADQLAQLLNANGRDQEAEQLRRFGVDPSGRTAAAWS
ncbi:hypothetical protein [Streptomyces sp. NPDC020681]|uniref:hypothetical protein n=1 Tax=Streptomyces sp. NPDC020681 TaxID=3365083 RepID=UPI00378CB8EC